MKNQIFINNEYEYDYDCIKKGKKEIHTLYYAAVETWTEALHDKPVMIIEDNGDGINVVTKLNYKNIDYLDVNHLLILLKIINSQPPYQNVYEIGTKQLL
jgi:hypothetical protein